MRSQGFKSVGEWKEAATRAGYRVPISLCSGVTIVMKCLGLGFAETFELMLREHKIILVNKAYIYNENTQGEWLTEMKDFRKLVEGH